jgi:CRP-like cAMP-binding protein
MQDEAPRALNDFKLLGRLETFSWLSASQQKRLAAAMSSYSVERDELIFAADDASLPDVFILLSGAARLSYVSVKRGRMAIALLAPGMITLPTQPARFSGHFRCEAFRQSRIAKISRDSFIEIALGIHSPDFHHLAKLLFGGIDGLLTRYPSFVGLNLRSRLAVALLDLGAAFGAHDSRGIVLTITPTQQDLADLVAASRPKVSIVLSEFVRQGAIDRAGRRIALVPSKLEQIAQAGA